MQLQEQEDKANKMYLHMYAKGQEAERQEQADRVIDMARQSPSRVSVPELMQQLQVTQEELENIRVSRAGFGKGNFKSLSVYIFFVALSLSLCLCLSVMCCSASIVVPSSLVIL